MRNLSSFRLLPAIGLLCVAAWVGCDGVERGPSGYTPTDGGVRDLAGGGSCTVCNGLCCANRCVDPKTDVANCGGCNIKCRAGEVCFGGLCQCGGANGQGTKVCTKDEACCGSKCVNVQNDATNCGACGNSCAATGEACFNGACGCGSANAHCNAEETCCGSSCADIQTDATNCGSCGAVCPNGGTCANGTCEMGGGGNCNGMMCQPGETCVPMLGCVPLGGGGGGGGLGGLCMSDADCMKGQKCVMPLPGLPIGICQ